MKRLLLLCLLILSVDLIGQEDHTADSLVNLLNERKNTSEQELAIYKEFCLIYSYNDTEKFIEYSHKGAEMAEKYHENTFLIWFYTALGEAYTALNEFDTGMEHYNAALALATKEKNEALQAWVNLAMGNAYSLMQKSETAMEHYQKALPYVEKNNKQKHSAILTNIGVIHRSLSNYDRALYYLNKSDSLARELNDDHSKMYIACELGIIGMKLSNWDEALEQLQIAIDLSRKKTDKSLEIVALQTIVIVYSDGFKDIEKATEYADLALKTSLEYGEPRLIAGSWLTLSNLHRDKNQYKECEATALKAWEIDSTYFDSGYNILDNVLWANIYLNPSKASTYLDRMNGYVTNHIRENAQQILLDMETKYETEKKEMRIALLEEEQKRYTWLSLAAGAIVLLLLGIVFYRYRLNVQKRRMAEQQIKQLEQEKQLIATQAILDGETAERSRLARDLHDGLGGMLSVVKLNLKDMKNAKALELLDESIGELRRVAHHIMPESLIRYGLRVSLEDFCRSIPIAQFQYLGQDSRLDSRLEVMIYRSVYELVNNALKHANASTINIQLLIDNGMVAFTVYDDGMGFDPDKAGAGTGLQNIRTRVSAYNGKMSIRSAPGKGTEITIEIESV